MSLIFYVAFISYLGKNLIFKEYYKDLLQNNLVKKDEETTYSSRPSYVGNCTTRRTSYTRAIFSPFLWHTASSSSLKSGFPTFCTEEKFDAGDWKALCGMSCRHRLANNQEITRRFCLFSRVSLSNVHARFCEVHVSNVR